MKGRLRHLLMGGLATLLLGLATAYLSARPTWRSLPEETALLRLSFTHSGERACRQRTPAELAALPPNMRQRKICDRRRPPVYVELEVDRTKVFAASAPPTGLSDTGPSRVYERFQLPAGEHQVTVRMRDRPDTEGFDYTATKRITLAPAQSFVIDFRPEQGGFIFQ